jgi:hypothetical protein
MKGFPHSDSTARTPGVDLAGQWLARVLIVQVILREMVVIVKAAVVHALSRPQAAQALILPP